MPKWTLHSLGLFFSQQFNVIFWLSLENKVSQTPLNKLKNEKKKNEVYTLRGHWWMFSRIVIIANSAHGTWRRLKKHTEESNAQHECPKSTGWAISHLKILCPFESKDLGYFLCVCVCVFMERQDMYIYVYSCMCKTYSYRGMHPYIQCIWRVEGNSGYDCSVCCPLLCLLLLETRPFTGSRNSVTMLGWWAINSQGSAYLHLFNTGGRMVRSGLLTWILATGLRSSNTLLAELSQ